MVGDPGSNPGEVKFFLGWRTKLKPYCLLQHVIINNNEVFGENHLAISGSSLVIVPSVLVIMEELSLPQHPSHHNEDIPDSW